uniref:Uncharacterized protein n=1 Tax=Globodera rostochiensis TaxID=31243 RepID=A0A914H8K1_GLORO
MYKLCCSGNGEYQGGKVPKDLPLMIDLRFFYSVKMAVVFILMLLSSTTLKAQRNENDKFYDLMAAIGEHFGGELNKAEKALELDLNESELSIFDYWIEIIEMKTKNTQKPIFGVAIYSEKYDGFKSEGSKERAFKLSRENYKILKQLNDQKFSIYESLNLLKAAFNWAYSPTRRIDPELHFDSQDKEIQQEVQKDFEENCKKFENEEEKIMFLNNVHYELAINFEFNHRKGKEQQEHQHQHHQQAQLKQAKKVGDSRRRRRPGAWPTRAIGGMEQECEGSGVQRAKIQQGQVVQRGQAFVRTGQTGTGEAGQWGFSGVQLAEVHPGQNFLQHGQFRFGQAGIGGSGQTGGQGGGGFQLAGIQASQQTFRISYTNSKSGQVKAVNMESSWHLEFNCRMEFSTARTLDTIDNTDRGEAANGDSAVFSVPIFNMVKSLGTRSMSAKPGRWRMEVSMVKTFCTRLLSASPNRLEAVRWRMEISMAKTLTLDNPGRLKAGRWRMEYQWCLEFKWHMEFSMVKTSCTSPKSAKPGRLEAVSMKSRWRMEFRWPMIRRM